MPSAAAVEAARPYLANIDDAARTDPLTTCPWWLLCAVLDKETDGRNIYGHDQGGAFSDPTGANIEVTEANYAQFRDLVLVQHKTSNGVGPMQLTYPGFFTDMEKQGLKPWVPYDNILYGARLLGSYYTAAAGEKTLAARVAKVGTRYNGNASYGDDLVKVALQWAVRLITKETPMPLTAADLAAIKGVVDARILPLEAKLDALPKPPSAQDVAAQVWGDVVSAVGVAAKALSAPQ